MSPLALSLSDLFPYLLVLSRVTGAIMMLPGLGSQFINTPVRILLAMALSAVMAPLLMESMPDAPTEPYLFFSYVIVEAFIGLFIGSMGRMLLASLELAGSVIGFQSGLMNAFILNPVDGRQSPLPATYLSVIVLALIFVADIHHVALQAIFDSYRMFHPGQLVNYSALSRDFMSAILSMVTEAFVLGTQIAAPIIILSLLFFVGMGLLNRLMPQLQVFFIAQPFQIFVGFMVLSMLMWSACSSMIERLAYLYANLWHTGG